MNILLLGSGGRECAIAWKLSQSPRLGTLYVAPGNAGMAAYATLLPQVKPTDFEAVAQAALAHDVQMIVVGNEDPLVAGIVDYFQNDDALRHILMVGPSKAGAQLEGSKDFAKEFMLRNGIPTARHLSVTAATIEEGFAFMDTLQPPYYTLRYHKAHQCKHPFHRYHDTCHDHHYLRVQQRCGART